MTLLADLFLNSTGRIGRLPFVLGGGSLLLAGCAVERLTALPAWVDGAIAAALLYAGACLLSQRLHDRGRSGWWSGLILLALVLAWPLPHGLLDWVAAAALVLVVIDLVLLPGQAGFNRYGAAPGKGVQSGATPG
ncbi:DUF805 domain-containing protein [Brevundimonas naejangsanensis]|uniref:DUF805 domain-containing protein n=1 Tax=Brevundimonas naejangsanensis TaxID=588932 RepID=A0A494RGA3_9CAUL|nr:DUF805 domain-containing protein [Brevundimonas naejangsanensis]AYG95418.1 DUF805 domain-containing protein [Brevundimonas naejangsanensis]